ncbi:hypothetical protein BCR34DRAFT_588043 [Clohesyomyces aquaticus]|uniref:Uncharacterized protein n=1 Tax=Clohesyomyces aquaticus TaxID=1231657 RepID=A0A1Y1ZLU4_9PLEO|nr:hypothetical protein BCR34DRAFT_588043 [Clohesyomyces aquaticus]
MSAPDFDSALQIRDEGAFSRRLSELMTQKTDTSSALVSIADKYVQSFADVSVSHNKRRWIGLALCHMVEKRPPIAANLASRPQALRQLGAVMIGDTELEDIKVVAGAVIRQALQCGVEFASFWDSDKIPNNAAIFPKESSERWLQEFQQYVDILEVDLKLVRKLETDLAVVFAVAVRASDGFKKAPPSMIVTIVQGQYITLITPQSAPKVIGFIDIPLRLIRTFRLQKSLLYDSQAREVELEPWDLVLTLETGQWTYREDSEQHEASDFVITFATHTDAAECRSCVEKAIKRRAAILQSSTTIILDASASGDEYVQEVSQKRQERHQNADSTQKMNVPHPNRTGAEQAAHESHKPTRRISSSQTLDISAHANDRTKDLHLNDQLVRPTTNHVETGHRGPVPPRTSKNTDSANSAFEEEPDPVTDIDPTSKKPLPTEQLQDVSSPNNKAAAVLEKRRRSISRDIISAPIVPAKTQRKSVPGALPTIKSKPRRLQNQTENINSSTREEVDDFEFPDESSRMKRPPLRTKQSSGMKSQPGSSRGQTGGKNALDSGSSQAFPTTNSSARNPRVTSPSSKPASVPKAPQKAMGEATSRKRKHGDDDFFAIPLNEEPSIKRRTRREAAKTIDYNEAESSGYGSLDSEYTESKPTKFRAGTTDSSPRKARKKSRMSKGRGSTSKTTKAKTKQLSPEKLPVVGKMLSKLQPVRNELRKETNGDMARSPVEVKHTRKAIKKEPQTPQERPKQLARGNPNQHREIIELSSGCPSSSLDSEDKHDQKVQPQSSLDPHDIKRKGHAGPQEGRSQSEKTQLRHLAALEMPSTHSEAVSDQPSRKRTDEHFSAITPKAKRTKVGVDGALQAAKGDAGDAPRAIAPARILEDPESPSPETQQGHQRSSRPSARQSLNNLVQSSSRPTEGPKKSNASYYAESYKTPMHLYPQRRPSSRSANSELLSSNTKVPPSSPHAESKAISSYAGREQVDIELEIGEMETARSDPFKKNLKPRAQATAFVRRLTADSANLDEPDRIAEAQRSAHEASAASGSDLEIFFGDANTVPLKTTDSTRRAMPRKPVGADVLSKHQLSQGTPQKKNKLAPAAERKEVKFEDAVREASPQYVEETQDQGVAAMENGEDFIDGDETLVENVNESPILPKVAPPEIRSSPPQNGQDPSSSHSSTSAESESEPESEPSISPEVAEEMEWEASLQPHQRGISDQLTRISRRLLRHIVDNETAVSDIAESYARDGKHVLNQLRTQQTGELEGLFEGVERKKQCMKQEFEHLVQKLAEQRKQFMEPPSAVQSRMEV